MKKAFFGQSIWTIITALIILTWVLWFFRIDVRDFPSAIGTSLTDFNAKAELDSHSSQVGETQEDALIKSCRASYDECVYVATQKYGISVSLIKAEKFEEMTAARAFYKTWGSQLQFQISDSGIQGYGLYGVEFPVVLFALSARGIGGQQPAVLVCNKDGILTSESKQQLNC